MPRLMTDTTDALRARQLRSFNGRFQTIAVYAAFALITAIIIGSHSIHPF